MTNENLEESFRDFAIVVGNAYKLKSQAHSSSRAPSDSNSAKRKVRAKTDNQKTLSRLRDALRKIERATAPRKALREFPNIPTILPKKATFDELEGCIFLLARSLRKKKVFTFATATAAVAKRWPSLRLDIWLPSLLQRLRRLLGTKPTVTRAITALLEIEELATSGGSKSKAAAFLRDHRKLRAGSITLSDVDWPSHSEMLERVGASRLAADTAIHLSPNQQCDRCYSMYLEMERELLLSEVAQFQHLFRLRQFNVLRDWFHHIEIEECNAPFDKQFEKRKADKLRKRRHRARVKHR